MGEFSLQQDYNAVNHIDPGKNHENHVFVVRHQPAILILAALIVAITLLALRGNVLPLLSNTKVSVGIVLVLGFAMRAQGGLGYVGESCQWTHPLAIVGYPLGVPISAVQVGLFSTIALANLALVVTLLKNVQNQ